MKTRLRDPASWLPLAVGASSRNLVFTFQLSIVLVDVSTVLIGYCDYLRKRPKDSHRPIILTGYKVLKGHLGIVTGPYFGRFCHRVKVIIITDKHSKAGMLTLTRFFPTFLLLLLIERGDQIPFCR